MAGVKDSAYWKKRFALIEEAQNRRGVQCYAEIEKQYRQAQRQIETQIRVWYGRFADSNGVTMQEARRMLAGKELEEFKWDVRDYIRYGEANGVSGAWTKQLENASARFHISRLEALKLQTQQSLEVLFGNQLDTLDSAMRGIYMDGYYHTAFEIQKGMGVAWDFASLDNRTVSRVTGKPWAADGKNFSERVWQNRRKLVNELHTELTRNILLGQDPQKAIDAISRKMNTSRKNAGRLVMTEAAFFSSAAQKDCFLELDVEQYAVLATLDSRTSDICQAMDGKVFPMSQYEPGVTAPPFHVWCRSTTVPYFGDEFDHAGERGARGKDGTVYYVPGDMTYQEWKKTFADGGDKSGFDVYSQNGGTCYKRLPDASGNGIINSDDWQGINYSQSYSKKTAISRLQSEYGIRFHDSTKYAMDDGLLADCVGWLDSFQLQYGGFMKKSPCKIPVIDNKAPSGMKNTVGYYRYYTNSPNVVELALNGQYHSDASAFQKYVEQCVKSKWYPENATIHKTFVHEFGHHVSNSMRWITGNPAWQHEFIRECIDDFKKVEPNYTWSTFVGMGNYVSRYGATSESELFAETFAEYFGGQNPREFAKIFGRKLDALLKGVK